MPVTCSASERLRYARGGWPLSAMELEAVPEGPERLALYEQLVAQQYENGSAIHMASTVEIDAVIDPAHTRRWLLRGLEAGRVGPRQAGCTIDTW